jgi:hypothetical protein
LLKILSFDLQLGAGDIVTSQTDADYILVTSKELHFISTSNNIKVRNK